MPPRPRPPAAAAAGLRLSNCHSSLRCRPRRSYSTTTSASSADDPLIRVTNIPAPSSGHIRILELNRPAARNAISTALLASLRAHIDRVHVQYGPDGEETGAHRQQQPELGPTRALVLASAVDTCFCAGADLKERRGFSQQE
ncbi:hypothetical protein AAL_06122 [Moelleriella libera RCEF 2490]|uniref:Enoyl-CoA hydratase/isomerase family protein n=1 Tax=Moelleriella libera RCEF 2490 TaxID=1081109 RepID=A0A167ZCZ8_9HYPO|nr:hypothetical protein AAL_06122 [Moelleriella libera RCEF 2490]